MYLNNRIKAAKIGYIMISILLCVLGIVLIAVPDFSVTLLCRLGGGIMVLFGLVKIVGYCSKDLYRLAFQFDLAFGILLVALGVILIIRTDGSIREKVQAKYNCYQRGQHLRECDGQALYLAERVGRIVVAYADELFRKIKSEPYDKSIEQRIRQQDAEHNRQKQAAEKKIRAAQYKQKRYEDEVLKCLEGESAFSQEVLARLIAQAEAEVRQAKDEYASMLQNNDDRTTLQQIRSYYDEFLGWANEFSLATVERKRAILAQMFEKVEIGKGYKITIHVRGTYRQFLMGGDPHGEL